jgi:hypothetical protein
MARRWAIVVGMVSAGVMALGAQTAPAGAVTVGQIGTPTGSTCAAPVDRLQPTVTSGASYASPIDGTITSWSTLAGPNTGAFSKLKVFRLVAGNTYRAVGQDDPRPLVPSSLNTFVLTPGIEVQTGDLIGVNTTAGVPNCSFPVTGESYRRTVGTSDLANGQSDVFGTVVNDFRLNISAEVEPGTPPPPPPDGTPPPPPPPAASNDFSFGKVKRNKRKGTAKLTVKVPAPGELELAKTKKVKADDDSAEDAGKEKLAIKPKGKAKKKLNDKGKAKVKANVTYTPGGDAPITKSKRVKLVKR